MNKTENAKTPKQTVKQKPVAPKGFQIKWDRVWKILLFILLTLVAFVIKKVIIFQTHEAFDEVRKGVPIDILYYSVPAGIIYGIVQWLVHYYLDGFFIKHYVNLAKYPKLQDQIKKSYTFVKWAFSIVYYLGVSIWCYSILQKTSFLPWYLGGNGDPFKVMNDVKSYDSEITFEMKLYYLIQLGKHSARFFIHVFIRPEGNFMEFTLHHGITVFLVGYSYLTNFWLIGLIVFFLHDYSDFALALARLYRQYKHKNEKVLGVIYVHAFIFWISFRIFVFISACILPAINGIMNGCNFNAFELQVIRYPYYLMVFMMIMLEILQIFWTYFITESFLSVKVSKNIVHTYD